MNWTRSFILFVAALVTLGLSCQPAWSQGETGTISGTVTDATGAVIPGASVTAKSVATSAERTTTSRADGSYLLQELLPGFYDVTATSGNFAPFQARAEVTVGGKVTVDARLAVSGQTTTVEVVGVGGATVNTQSQELSQLVDSDQIAELPSLNRNAYDLVSLSGNVSNADTTSNGGAPNSLNVVGQSLTSRGVGYSINGQRESGTEILLDGAENVGIFTDNAGQPVPTDAIQEFSIVTNNFDAQYGRASGGIVNVDSKSGSNEIHGSAFEYNRLSAYTANTFANNLAGLEKGTYVRNDFGYSLGGPFIKNKLFGFFSEEFVRVRSNSSQVEDILDPSFISLLPSNVQSYFTAFGTGGPAPVSTVTAGQLAAAGIFSGPNFPDINGNTVVSPNQAVFDTVHFTAPFDAGGGLPQNTYNLLGRVDYNFTDKTTMFFRLARYRESDQAGATSFTPYAQYDVGGANFGDSELFSLNHAFSPTLLTVSKVSFTRFDVTNSFNQALTNTPNLYLSTSTSAQPTDPVAVNGLNNTIQLPGLENTDDGSGGLPFGGPQNTLQLQQDLAWTKGKHSMHFGGELTYIQLNVAYGAYAQANEVLGSDVGPALSNLVNSTGLMNGGVFASPILQFAARVNGEGALPCATDNFDNPIQTPACTVTPPLPSAAYARSYRYKDWDLYAGDSFKITRRLTINYALRYEHYGVQHNNNPSLDSNFFPGAGAFPENIRDGAVQFVKQSSIGQFWAPRWGTAAPRVGFAYDIFGDGKTSLRGGFGISYERNFGNVTYNASFNPPASAVLSSVCGANAGGIISTCGQFVTNNDLGPLGLPGLPTALTPVELRDDDAHINVAQTQFWSLAVEHELAPNTLISVSYSGAHSIHLYDLNNINLLGSGQALLGDPLTTTISTSGGVQCPFQNPGATAAMFTPAEQKAGDAVNSCYTRLNSQYTNINDRGSNGSGAYDGLNIKFQTTNFRHTGLTFIANYTWSHSFDDLSSTFSDSLTQGSLGYTNFQNPKLDWGSSDFDERHRVVLSPIWNTPWYKEGRGFLTQALGGWNISSIITARSGIPFSVYDLSYLLDFYVIPRLTPATPVTDFHVGANGLTVPPPANLGPNNPALGISDFGPYPANMMRRNSFRGPGAWNDDLAIGKRFKLTERFNLEFRAEAFNAFNHHNLYVNPFTLDYFAPTTTPLQVGVAKGGLGQAALGGNHDERRFGQFSLRLAF